MLVNQDERKLLSDFLKWLVDTKSVVNEFEIQPLTISGYNIKHFDLPFLEKRCEAQGLKMTNGFMIDDLMLRLYPKGYPFCESFDKAAARFGIHRRNGIRGSDVPRLWQEGKIDDVVAHNLDDIRAEFLLWKALQNTRQA